MIAQSSALLLPQIVLSPSLSLSVSSPAAGRDPDHYRVWEDDGGAERDLCHPGERHVFSFLQFFIEIYHCVCPLADYIPYLERHSLVLFQSDLKIKYII